MSRLDLLAEHARKEYEGYKRFAKFCLISGLVVLTGGFTILASQLLLAVVFDRLSVMSPFTILLGSLIFYLGYTLSKWSWKKVSLYRAEARAIANFKKSEDVNK